MPATRLIPFLFLLFIGNFVSAQEEKSPVTLGVELRTLQNFGILNIDSVVLQDAGQNFRAVYQNQGGFGFGGVVRVRLTDFWNLESGIYYTRRSYSLRISDASVGFEDELTFRQVGYEIPLKGLVYIRLGEKLFANVSLGVSADFFASDIEAVEQTYNIRAFKTSWIMAAILGNLGFEYRTEEDGYFYVGATFHRPFEDIMITQVNYYRGGDPPPYYQNGTLDGTYFSIDFRYFFPSNKEETKYRRVIPDWKNM